MLLLREAALAALLAHRLRAAALPADRRPDSKFEKYADSWKAASNIYHCVSVWRVGNASDANTMLGTMRCSVNVAGCCPSQTTFAHG